MAAMLLKGKTALITGAGSERGLGRACAQLFAEHGARVVVTDVDLDGARATAKTLKGRGHKAYRLDVTSKAQCEKIAARAIAAVGGIDILVNNAGISQPLKIMEVDAKNYDKVMDVNLRGTMYMSQAVIAHMRQRKSGSIVNLSSVSAQRGGGIFGGPHYSAAKAGILGLTKAMARELGPDNIRVNAICPSFIDTDITAGLMTPEKLAMIVASVPMARPGHAPEVAGCALFLASDLASYVTGSEIDVNGGSHIH
ncbi:MAG: SDR family oxidoreductase [Rhodobiaceae bacterium]|nr:SDR family oxidoreductase [Rhodobiaceae bacterium]